jgi:hypothetical protein
VTGVDHLSRVISHALAPSFLPGAVAGFIAVLVGRMNGIIDRIRAVNTIDDDSPRALPRLKRRARLLNTTVHVALASGISTTLLVVLAFGSALVGLRHEPIAGVLFMLALGLLGAALLSFAREVWIGLNDFDHHRLRLDPTHAT